MPESARHPVSAVARADGETFSRYQQTGDPALQEALVRRYLPLAHALAGRYPGRAERDDLEQVAAVGLLKAIDRYDPGRGLAFSSFAVPTILGELKRYFRDLGWTVRVPRDLQELALRLDRETGPLTAELGRSPTADELAQRCQTTTEHVLEALATVTAHRPDSLDRPRSEDDDESVGTALGGAEDPAYGNAENALMVDNWLRRLPEREQLILYLRFEHDLTQSEIGEHVGLSQMHVSRVIRASLQQLRSEAVPAP